MDPKKYKKQIETEKGSEAAVKAFNFIKGNAATSKTKSPNLEIDEKGGKSTYKGTDFSFALKNR
jgi:hypothetical protein